MFVRGAAGELVNAHVLCNRWMIIRFDSSFANVQLVAFGSVVADVGFVAPFGARFLIAVGWSVRAQGSVRTVGMPRGVVDSVVVFAILVSW